MADKLRMDWDREEIESQFSVPGALDGYEVVYSRDNSGSWETNYFGVLRKDGKLYKIECGTCSCYGCEGQFNPIEITLDELKNEFGISDSEWSAICDFLL